MRRLLNSSFMVVRMNALRSAVRSGERFQTLSVDDSSIIELKLPDGDYGKNYQAEVSKLLKETVQWPGCFTRAGNWREQNSFTFTTDFFGRPEAIATVRSLYVQVSKAILDALESLGFDISDYRDKEGNYSINAEKIDHLVVGEKIYVEKKAASETSIAAVQKGGQSPS
jgi:hypothetical protein